MTQSKQELWQRFQKHYTEFPSIKLALDLSRMNFTDGFFESMEPRIQKAFVDMAALENGAIANPDENRMVGHYWLRNSALSPTNEIKAEIDEAFASIKAFANDIHSGKIQGQDGAFTNLLVIGIGGSALGPQFVAHALGQPGKDKMKAYFFDNTDPDGMDRVLAQLGGNLGRTLAIVISKSGSTKETRNGMIEAANAYQKANLAFAKHAVAVTGKESDLDKLAAASGWIHRFPMWDWVGGRTSELSAVGLLPACLQGFDIQSIINGATACDLLTRIHSVKNNPASQIALAWYSSGNGKGNKAMVVLPYKDRLELFSKYLQQLIMESIGKEKDLNGNTVNQGLVVFGNKGATDQHSYIQQLRDGINNFFAAFIQVLQEREGDSLPVNVNDGVTSGDYLNGFYLGTRQALFENGRESLTITVNNIDSFTVGVLIALFERAVGLYANLVGINAYHQPGVEAGKRAAENIIGIQCKVVEVLKSRPGEQFTLTAIAKAINAPDEIEIIFKVCQHLSSNPSRGIVKHVIDSPLNCRFSHP